MAELKWTRGFCNNPKCGRYIRHFGVNCTCPQCGKRAPNQAKKGLITFGIDYLLGYILGTMTCAKWSVPRIIERILLKIKIKPRIGEETSVYFLLLLSLVIFFVASSYKISANSYVGVLLVAWLVYRIVEIIFIRVRIILYDRRLLNWKHASYARSLLLLFFNMAEVVIIYAAIYAIAFSTIGYEYNNNILLLVYSISGWGAGLVVGNAMQKDLSIHLITLSKNAVLFLLVGLGLSALINMMSAGSEVHKQ